MSEIKLKDVLHFYIGCDVKDTFNDCILNLSPRAYFGYMQNWDKPEDCQIKPLLRPLSDMTELEAASLDLSDAQIGLLSYGEKIQMFLTATQFQEILGFGFDLFNLIESSQAISSPALKGEKE